MPVIFKECKENPSGWRTRISDKIAEKIDLDYYGVEGVYLIGSAKRYSAGQGSDIDLLIHFKGTEEQKREMMAWFRGWGECLAFFNSEITGSKSENLLDVHLITDEDILNKTSFAVMINSVNDRAKPLKIK
jgi:predicted nucleotidyltransferase